MRSVMLAAVSFFTVLAHGEALSQAVQAVQGAGIRRHNISALVDTVRGRQTVYLTLLGDTGPKAPANRSEIRPLLLAALRDANLALEAHGDIEKFNLQYRQFLKADRALLEALPPEDLPEMRARGIQLEPLSNFPQIQTAAPNVSFVASLDYNSTESDNIGLVGLHTNLLGAAAGTAFDALGSDGLKEYFTNNVSAGTTIPFGGASKLAAQIGFGLGGVSLGGLTFWPAVNLEQTDTADARVPNALRARLPAEKNWSSPSLAIAVVPSRFLSRMQEGKAAILLTLGIRLPYFYPGDPFSALAAMFSAKRNDFEKQGKAHFVGGISIPLFRVEAPKDGD